MGVSQAQIPDTIINKDSNPIIQEITINQTNQGTYKHAMYVPFPEEYSEQNSSLRLYDQEGELITFVLQGRTQHEYIIWCNITLKQGQNAVYLTLGNESLGSAQNTSSWYQGPTNITSNLTNVTTFNQYTHLIFKQDTPETGSYRFIFNVTHYENTTQYRSLTLDNKSTIFQPTGTGESYTQLSSYYDQGYEQHNELNIDRQNQRMTITGSSTVGHVYLDAPINKTIKQPVFMTINGNTTSNSNITVTWIGMNSSANPGTLKTEYGENLIKDGNVLLTIYNVAWANAPLSLIEYKGAWSGNVQNPNPVSYSNYNTAVRGNSTGTYGQTNILVGLNPIYQANCTINGDTFDIRGQSKMLRPTYIMNDTGKVIVLTDTNVMQLQNKTTLMPYVYDTEYIKHIYSPLILSYDQVTPAGPSQGFVVQYKDSLRPVQNFTYVQSVYATGVTDSQVKVNRGASSIGVGNTNLNQDVTVNITPQGSSETFDFWIQSQGVQNQTRWTILEVEEKFDINIKVVDSETGDPINTFTTFFGEQQSIRSTDDGTVTYKGVGGGEQQVIIQADGYNQVSRGIYIQEDNQTFILRVSKIASGDQEIVTPLFATFRIYNQNADLVYNQNVIIKDIDTDVELFNQTLSGTQAFTVKLDRTARYSLTVIKESSQINKTFNISGLNDGDTYSTFVNEVFPASKPTILGSTDVEWNVTPLYGGGGVYVNIYYKMNFQGNPYVSGKWADLHYSSRNGGAEGDITSAAWGVVVNNTTYRVSYLILDDMYEGLKQNNTTFSVSQDITSNHTNPTTQNIYSTYYVGEGQQGLIDLGLDDEQYSYLALQLIVLLTLGMATQSNVPMTIQTTCVSALFFMWLGWLVLHPFFQALLQVGVLLSLLSIATSER